MRASSSGWAPIHRMRERSAPVRTARTRGDAIAVTPQSATGSIINLMRSRRFIALIYGCFALTVGCQRERVASPPATTSKAVQDLKNVKVKEILPTAPAPVDKCLVGSSIGPDGNVTAEQRSFRPNEPIRVTLWLHDSPSGLQTSAHWLTDKGKEITAERKEMNGAKVATFTLDKKLKPGKYSVRGLWGGNDACEYDFEVKKK